MRRTMILFFATLAFVGCGSDGDSPSDVDSTYPTNVTNGADLDHIESHWDSGGTTWSYLFVSFLDDGTAQLNLGNGDFYPESITRQLHEGTWTALRNHQIRLTVMPTEGEPFEILFKQVDGGLATESISAMVQGGDGEFVELNFVLTEGPPQCC